MKKIFVAACCILGAFSSSQVKGVDQRQVVVWDCVQLAYPGGEKHVPARNLTLEPELINAEGIQIKNLSKESVDLVMQNIVDLKLEKLRIFAVEGCPLSDQFAEKFNQLRKNNSNLLDVCIQDSISSLSDKSCFEILVSLGNCSTLRKWRLSLPALSSAQMKVADMILRHLTKMNMLMEFDEPVHTKYFQEHDRVQTQLWNLCKICKQYENKLSKISTSSVEYARLQVEYEDFLARKEAARQEQDKYWAGSLNLRSGSKGARHIIREGIGALESLHEETEESLKWLANRPEGYVW